MTLAASGEMSIGGSTATRSINLELGRAAGATSSLGEAALRTLAGVASGAISMINFYNKSNRLLAFNDATAIDYSQSGNGVAGTLTFTTTGTITTAKNPINTGTFTAPASFISPTGDTTGISIRCNFTSILSGGSAKGGSVLGTNIAGLSSFDSGYVSIAGANKAINLFAGNGSSYIEATGTIYITDGTTTISRAIFMSANG
jgi:hypothetical protein